MQLQSILTPERTLCGAPGSSKKRVFETVADFICNDIPELSTNEIFSALIAREKLGSTGVGNGIAIPHCRMKNCRSTFGALIKLQQTVDFDAIDDHPVDILFVLLVPEESNQEHLQTLATLAELFDQTAFCKSLRNAQNSEALYQSAINFQQAA